MLAVRQKIGLVICPNKDRWHNEVFVSYIIWNRKMLDEPDAETCLRIIRSYEGMRDLEVVERTCLHCQKRLPRR